MPPGDPDGTVSLTAPRPRDGSSVRPRAASGPRTATLDRPCWLNGARQPAIASGPCSRAGCRPTASSSPAAGQRFPFHGVSYGTFAPRPGDGAQFPERSVLDADLRAMRASRLHGRAHVHRADRRPARRGPAARATSARRRSTTPTGATSSAPVAATAAAMARAAEAEIRRQAARLAGRDEVLAVVVGNEVPADAVRWFGTPRTSSRVLGRLADAVHEADPDLLVTYANYPTSEYLDVDGVDFLTFNVFLERQDDLRRYLTRLHHLAGDRPLVLGEIGLHAGDDDAGEERQAEVVDWQLATALERGVGGTCLFSWTDEWWVGGAQVEGWRFGLTRRDRSPRPALDVAAAWNRRTVADLDYPWPSITVAICAYNSASTLDECLRAHEPRSTTPTSRSSSSTTARPTPPPASPTATHGCGSSRSSTAGCRSPATRASPTATGDLVAYLDSDAYPTPGVAVLPRPRDGRPAGRRASAGPTCRRATTLPAPTVSPPRPAGRCTCSSPNDRAEHVPGCNMAFWKPVLTEVGGFDPVYTAAGDDVDVCWKVLDRGWEIGFHPAALVWHHRRPDGARPTCASSAATAGPRRWSPPATPTASPAPARPAGVGASTRRSLRRSAASASTAAPSPAPHSSRCTAAAATPSTSPTRSACPVALAVRTRRPRRRRRRCGRLPSLSRWRRWRSSSASARTTRRRSPQEPRRGTLRFRATRRAAARAAAAGPMVGSLAAPCGGPPESLPGGASIPPPAGRRRRVFDVRVPAAAARCHGRRRRPTPPRRRRRAARDRMGGPRRPRSPARRSSPVSCHQRATPMGSSRSRVRRRPVRPGDRNAGRRRRRGSPWCRLPAAARPGRARRRRRGLGPRTGRVRVSAASLEAAA